MVQSKAETVARYLRELPTDRRAAIEALRGVLLDNVDDDIIERMSYGMIGYHVSLDAYPAGYHCDPSMPLPFAGLASQKNHMSLYLMCHYADPEDAAWFQKAWKATGKRLDMGKSCVRFKKIEDVPLDVVAEAVRRMPSRRYVAVYEAAFGGGAKPGKKAAKK
jgi:hypothetical protein